MIHLTILSTTMIAFSNLWVRTSRKIWKPIVEMVQVLVIHLLCSFIRFFRGSTSLKYLITILRVWHQFLNLSCIWAWIGIEWLVIQLSMKITTDEKTVLIAFWNHFFLLLEVYLPQMDLILNRNISIKKSDSSERNGISCY